jgi:small subunit ribosomal protein S16
LSVRIRLRRAGGRHRPFYKIIVSDSRGPRDGADIESLGYYDPLKHPENIRVDEDRYNHWLSVGASASESVVTLLRRLKKRAAGGDEPELVKEPRAGRSAAAAAPVVDESGAEKAEETGAGGESEVQ